MAITPPWCSCLRARASASPHETRLVEATFQQTFTPHGPEKLIGDRAYDSAPLDQRLQSKWGVELIAPHKTNRSKPPTPGRMKHNRTA